MILQSLLTANAHQCSCDATFSKFIQERLQHVLDEMDPVDLSHVMWAMARFDSYPAPGLVDEVLATLPPQIASAEPAVSSSSCAAFFLSHLDSNRRACLCVPGQT